jgi:type I restriction enzyme S subunit
LAGRRNRAAAVAAEPVDQPWHLPDDWEWERLSAVSDIPERGEPRTKFSDRFSYLDVSAIDAGTLSPRTIPVAYAPSRARQFLRPNDTIISGVRVYLRNFAFVEEGGPDVASTAFCVLRPKQKIDPKYLFYWIRSDQFIQRLLSLQRGNSPPAVLDADIREQPIPVPPLPVQRKIVSRVSKLFAEIEEGESALADARAGLDTHRKSILNAAVTGQLTANWRNENSNVETGSDLLRRIESMRNRTATSRGRLRARAMENEGNSSVLPALPDTWTWASLPQLGEFGRGKSKHRPRNDPRLYGGPYPFIQTGIVAAGNGTIDAFDQTYSELGVAQSKLWPAETVCITIAANIAASGILKFAACFPDSVVGLICCKSIVPEFVEIFIRTARENLERFAPATAQKNINLEILYELRVPLPPTAEQREIVRLVNQSEQMAADFDGEISTQIRDLKQSVLQAAFRGKLVE